MDPARPQMVKTIRLVDLYGHMKIDSSMACCWTRYNPQTIRKFEEDWTKTVRIGQQMDAVRQPAKGENIICILEQAYEKCVKHGLSLGKV